MVMICHSMKTFMRVVMARCVAMKRQRLALNHKAIMMLSMIVLRFSKDEEVGGNALVSFGSELILPMPFKGDWADQVRPVLFAEGGQVFDTTDKEDRNFVDPAGKATINPDGSPVKLLTQDNKMRFSAGAGVTWYTPIGPISLSYAVPIGDKDGDETEKVQFQIGNTF